MIEALVGAVVTAAVSTLGDYLWANVLPHGQPIYWFAHAIVLFATVGFCLGLPSRKPTGRRRRRRRDRVRSRRRASIFSSRSMGYSGDVRAVRRAVDRRSACSPAACCSGGTACRLSSCAASLAAVGSGLGFYAISGIWMPFNPHGWDYAKHFVYWTLAYLPGFAALLVRKR